MILGEESSGWTVTEVDPSGETLSGGPIASTSVGDAVDPGMPTGPLPISPAPATSTARIVTQTVIVVAVAVLVGTFVFLVVRAAVGAGSDSNDQDAQQDERSVIDPGPSGDDPALGDSTRSGSRRSEGADGSESQLLADEATEEEPAGPLAAVAAAEADADPASPSTTIPPGEAQAGEAEPTASSGPATTFGEDRAPGPSVSSADPNPAATVPGPSPRPTVASTAATIVASTTIAPITTTTAVQATTTTVASPTTSAPSPTPTPAPTIPTTIAAPPTVPIIALPSDGNRRAWETFTRFRAVPVDGASRYCWTFVSSGGGQRQSCSSDVIYDLPATPRGLLPGPLAVKAEAFTADSTRLAEDSISINLIVGDVAHAPRIGEELDLSRPIDLRSDRVESADRYCWTIIQGAVSTGEICDGDRRFRIEETDSRLDGFNPGAARVRSMAYRGDDLIAREGRRVVFG